MENYSGLSQSTEQKREIIFRRNHLLDLQKRGEKSRLSSKNQFKKLNDEDLCLLFMKQDLLVCVHCNGVWSAKSPIKVRDTNISMTWFHKLTFNVFDCGSFQLELCLIWWLLRYFKPVLAVECGANLNSVYFVQMLQLKVEFWKSSFCSVSSYKVKAKLIEIVKNMITFPFWKSSDRSITNVAEICKILQTWFAIKKK